MLRNDPLARAAVDRLVDLIVGLGLHLSAKPDGVALGIAFDVEPLSAALAALAAVLTTASFVYAWRYFDEAGTLFHVLMLTFLAAMSGFVLANLFAALAPGYAGLLGARAAGTGLTRPTLRVVAGGAAAMLVTALVGRLAHLAGI